MKELKIVINHFVESEYTYDPHQKATFKSALARKGINELNYIMLTINCPKRIEIWEKKKQFDYLVKLLNKLNIFYVACIEWSDERANGYHLHIIVSKDEFNIELIPDELLVDDLFNKSVLLGNNSLDRCLGYICKERKGCTTANRKEKFYFSNIQERKLVPIGVRPVIKEETPIDNVEAQREQVVNIPQAKPEKKLRVFFKELFKKVKTLISRLFIISQEQHYYDYSKKIICQSTRDGPA